MSLGKCTLSSLLPTHGYDLLEHSPFPRENMSSGEQQYTVCVFSVPVHVLLQVRACVQCVEPEGECASVQLSGSDYDLTRPLFVHMKSSAPPATLAMHRLPACMCLCVSENARFTHVTAVEAAAALSCFARLRRAAARWPLKGLCLLHA